MVKKENIERLRWQRLLLNTHFVPFSGCRILIFIILIKIIRRFLCSYPPRRSNLSAFLTLIQTPLTFTHIFQVGTFHLQVHMLIPTRFKRIRTRIRRMTQPYAILATLRNTVCSLRHNAPMAHYIYYCTSMIRCWLSVYTTVHTYERVCAHHIAWFHRVG